MVLNTPASVLPFTRICRGPVYAAGRINPLSRPKVGGDRVNELPFRVAETKLMSDPGKNAMVTKEASAVTLPAMEKLKVSVKGDGSV